MIYNFDSAQAGAPVLSGSAGALRALLKACLVDGFGAGAVATLTVTSGVATATYAGAHPFAPGRVVEISGATPAALNGKKIVATTTGASITFPAPGVPDGSATGTISSKAAAPGWLELFAGALTNVIVLKPAVPEATGCVLRVDDSTATTGLIAAYESMSDISTGVGRFPTAAQMNSGLHWPKSSTADSSARRWICVADERAVLLWVALGANALSAGVCVGFGDLDSYKSGDAYGCYLSGGASAALVTTGSAAVPGCLGYAAGTSVAADLFVARRSTALGGAQLGKKVASHNTAGAYSGSSGYNSNGFTYPNPADNALRLSPVELVIATGLRGRIPGVYHTPQLLGDAFATGDLVTTDASLGGRRMLALRCGPPAGSAVQTGTMFVDVTGPWRV